MVTFQPVLCLASVPDTCTRASRRCLRACTRIPPKKHGTVGLFLGFLFCPTVLHSNHQTVLGRGNSGTLSSVISLSMWPSNWSFGSGSFVRNSRNKSGCDRSHVVHFASQLSTPGTINNCYFY